jgi:hypothetical protein
VSHVEVENNGRDEKLDYMKREKIIKVTRRNEKQLQIIHRSLEGYKIVSKNIKVSQRIQEGREE